MFYEIITNQALVVPVSAWTIAQLTKMSIALLQGKGLDFRYMVSSGGMPSAHSAVVTALATTVGMTQGIGSALFGATVILAMIVMYDAAGVRQSVSQQSVVLNRIVRELRLRHSITSLEADMRELIGHTPFQVIVGAVSGFVLAWLWITIAAM